MKKKLVEFDDFTVTVKELNVRAVKTIVTSMKELFEGDNVNVQEILTDRLNEVLLLAEDLLEFSKEKDVLDLYFSEIDVLVPAIIEVNASFLGQMAALGLYRPPQIEENQEENAETE